MELWIPSSGTHPGTREATGKLIWLAGHSCANGLCCSQNCSALPTIDQVLNIVPTFLFGGECCRAPFQYSPSRTKSQECDTPLKIWYRPGTTKDSVWVVWSLSQILAKWPHHSLWSLFCLCPIQVCANFFLFTFRFNSVFILFTFSSIWSGQVMT